MFKEMANLAGLMRHAQAVPAKIQQINDRLRAEVIETSAGDGAVRITANGLGEVQDVGLHADKLAPTDHAELGRFIAEAVNASNAESKQRFANAVHEAAGDLPLPGLQDALEQLVTGGRKL